MNYYIHFVTDLLLNWLMPKVLESATATVADAITRDGATTSIPIVLAVRRQRLSCAITARNLAGFIGLRRLHLSTIVDDDATQAKPSAGPNAGNLHCFIAAIGSTWQRCSAITAAADLVANFAPAADRHRHQLAHKTFRCYCLPAAAFDRWLRYHWWRVVDRRRLEGSAAAVKQ